MISNLFGLAFLHTDTGYQRPASAGASLLENFRQTNFRGQSTAEAMQETNVIFLPPCPLAYVRVTGPYPTASAQAWQRILDWLSKRGHEPVDGVGYGLSIDDPRRVPAQLLRYDACVKIPTTWSELDTGYVGLRQFRGGAYFMTRHTGSYGNLGRLVSEARDILIPRQGLVHDSARAVLTMNYSNPMQTPPGQQLADICIPVLPIERQAARVLH